MTYKVTRINDGREWITEEYKFITYTEDNRGKELVDNPIFGSSLILPPYTLFTQWLTSPIIEVIGEKEFKTNNSHYKIEEYGTRNNKMA